MTRGRRICETIHLAVLGAWLGVLLMTGAAAAMLFPTIRALAPTLPGYARYEGPHWSLAAGKIAAVLFFLADAAQFAGVLAAGATLGVSILAFGVSMRSRLTALRGGVLIALLGLLSYQLLVLAPGMHADLASYWLAAEAGDNAAAARFKAAFDARHPLARTLLAVDAAAVLVLLVAGVWSATDRGRSVADVPVAAPPVRLEEPMLARGRRA